MNQQPGRESESNTTEPELGATDTSGSNLVGTRVGDYQVLRRLGRGGMADVYVALHETLDRQVALKVLRRQLAADNEYVERFRREARAAAKLSHPNIVQVYEVGRAAGHHYIAQELIDGPNLKQQVDGQGPLAVEEAAAVMRAVTSALAAAHQAGITHRDIKPENILRSQAGEIKVADFGLARVGTSADLTQAGLTMGTPRYMSPEQVQGKGVDARSDLYSFGCTLYFLLCGRPPFEAEDPLAVAVQHMHDTPPPLERLRTASDLPDWMLAAIKRMMNKNPADRFASASELAEWLCDQSGAGALALAGGTADATVVLQRAMLAESARRRRANLRRAAWATVAMVSLALGALWGGPTDPRTITTLLRPQQVPAKESVQQQYLAAVSRNDEAGWRAVRKHFSPQENTTNAAYAVKADLQLARLFLRQGRQDEARTILERISNDTTIDRLYRIVAIAELIDLGAEEPQQLDSLWDQLAQNYQQLRENNPEVARSLESIIGTTKVQRIDTR